MFLFKFSLRRQCYLIKEVEMVDSMDDLNSSGSIQRNAHFSNFELLDARIASALNKIIQSSSFKKKVSLEEQKAPKDYRFLRGRQIAYIIYDYFRVPGAHDTVLHYADLFTVALRNDDIQEFDTGWDEISIIDRTILTWWLSGETIQTENTRVWSTQHCIGIVQSRDLSKESEVWLSEIEDNGKHTYRADGIPLSVYFISQKRDANYGKSARSHKGRLKGSMARSKCRKQLSLSSCGWVLIRSGQFKITGSVLKETIAVSVTISTSVQNWHSRIRLRILSCGRMSENHREPEFPEARVPVVECLNLQGLPERNLQ